MPLVTFWRGIFVLTACVILNTGPFVHSQTSDPKIPVRTDAYGDPLPPGAIARLGTIRLRHGGQIGCVTFSPDGQTLASCGADNLIKFWDPETGKEKASLKGHTAIVWSIAFSPDGKTLASGSADETIKLWDLSRWKAGATITPILTLNGHTEPIRCVAFNPDGKMLASACEDATIRLWDLSAWRGNMAGADVPVFTLKGRGGHVFSVAFSPDGKTLASASDDKAVKLWDVTGRQLLASLQHDHPAMAVAFGPDRKTLASGARNGVLRLWDLRQGNAKGTDSPVLTIEAHHSWIDSLAFSQDGKTLASGSWDGTVKIWDVGDWRPGGKIPSVRTLEREFSVNSVAFSPDGKTLAAGGGDNVVKLWDVVTGQKKAVPKAQLKNEINGVMELEGAHEGQVRAVAFSPDGRTVATAGSTDRTIRLWRLSSVEAGRSARPVLTFTRQTGRVFCLAFSPDGKTLASGGAPATLTIWDIPSGAERETFQVPDRGFRSLAYSPDGRTLASAGIGGPIRLWDLKSGKEKKTLNGPIWFSSLAFASDGKRIASGGGDGTVKLWDVGNGREWASLTHGDEWIYSVAFSPDGKTLAAGTGDDEVMLWDVVAAKPIGALQGHNDTVQAVVFSPDGKTLATGGEDSVVKLWDLTKCRSGVFSRQPKTNPNVWYRNNPQSAAQASLVRNFAGHLASITGVAFSPNGTILASSSRDTTVLLWDVAKLSTNQDKGAPALAPLAIISCWNDLAGENAAKAYEAVWTLASVPGQAIPHIREHVRAALLPDVKRMDRLFADLDSNDFSARKNAGEELEKMQGLAASFLRRQLTKQLSLEARRRIEQLLEKIDGPVTDPEQLRQLRAIEVLEHIGSPESREVLKSVSKGDPEARLTIEAKASLKRLEKAGR